MTNADLWGSWRFVSFHRGRFPLVLDCFAFSGPIQTLIIRKPNIWGWHSFSYEIYLRTVSISFFCYVILPLSYIYLLNLVTSYTADSKYSVFIGYQLWCVINQISLCGTSCERRMHRSKSSWVLSVGPYNHLFNHYPLLLPYEWTGGTQKTEVKVKQKMEMELNHSGDMLPQLFLKNESNRKEIFNHMKLSWVIY